VGSAVTLPRQVGKAIALENARLLNELRESLEQQTATSDVLNVISRSPTDVQPVFEIIGECAERLCEAGISIVSRVEGELIHLVSLHGVAEEGVEAVRRAFPMRRSDDTVTARESPSRTERPWLRVSVAKAVRFLPLDRCLESGPRRGRQSGLVGPVLRHGFDLIPDVPITASLREPAQSLRLPAAVLRFCFRHWVNPRDGGGNGHPLIGVPVMS
jgi:hypothetical protein